MQSVLAAQAMTCKGKMKYLLALASYGSNIHHVRLAEGKKKLFNCNLSIDSFGML